MGYVSRPSSLCLPVYCRSVLTGLYEASAGTATVYGQDIRTNMDDIRHSLGLCPQHNILFDLLTVREHLLFYGMMRGLGYSHVSRNIPRWVWPGVWSMGVVSIHMLVVV